MASLATDTADAVEIELLSVDELAEFVQAQNFNPVLEKFIRDREIDGELALALDDDDLTDYTSEKIELKRLSIALKKLKRKASSSFASSASTEGKEADAPAPPALQRNDTSEDIPDALNPPGHWDIFSSHMQLEGGVFAEGVFAWCRENGLSNWLDVKMDERDEAAMEEGVRNSKKVLVIISPSYFKRAFCIKELEWAVKYEKQMVVVIDTNLKNKIGDILQTCPPHLRGIGSINWIDLNRGDKDYWELGMKKMTSAKTKILKFDELEWKVLQDKRRQEEDERKLMAAAAQAELLEANERRRREIEARRIATERAEPAIISKAPLETPSREEEIVKEMVQKADAFVEAMNTDLTGTKLTIRWADKVYYPGTITESSGSNVMEVLYDDGDVRKYTFSKKKGKLVANNSFGDSLVEIVELVSAPITSTTTDRFPLNALVEARFKAKTGAFYPGVVTGYSDSAYDIAFDDGDTRNDVPEDEVRARDSALKHAVYSKIEARFKAKTGAYYPGTVTSRNTSSYNVQFNDGDKREKVPENEIRARTKTPLAHAVDAKIEARFKAKTGAYYPGKVVSRNETEETYNVLFDDGDTRDGVPEYEIRARADNNK